MLRSCIMASAPVLRQRKRKLCSKCGQNLSHTAYARHQNPLICPGRADPKRKRDDFAQSLSESDRLPRRPTPPTSSHCDETDVLEEGSFTEESGPGADSNADSSTKYKSGSDCEDIEPVEPDCEGVEIVSDTEENAEDESQEDGIQSNQSHPDVEPSESSFDKQNESHHEATQEMGVIAMHVCLFITFFQLCYKVPERGITLLLNFLRVILLWLSKYLNETLALHDMIPQNAYFLKKALTTKIRLHTYVVCPKCHELYNPDDCIIRLPNGTTESLRCTFVEHPNHPHISR